MFLGNRNSDRSHLHQSLNLLLPMLNFISFPHHHTTSITITAHISTFAKLSHLITPSHQSSHHTISPPTPYSLHSQPVTFIFGYFHFRSHRKMFPVVSISVSGLEPSEVYSIAIDFIPGPHKYKYDGCKWNVSRDAELHSHQKWYVHPDSPQLGGDWQRKWGITFHKLKITHNHDHLHHHGYVSCFVCPKLWCEFRVIRCK